MGGDAMGSRSHASFPWAYAHGYMLSPLRGLDGNGIADLSLLIINACRLTGTGRTIYALAIVLSLDAGGTAFGERLDFW